MLIEQIDGFTPVENDDGEVFMLPIVLGYRFRFLDSSSYGEVKGNPTICTYMFRTRKITHIPAQVAEMDKYGHPKREFGTNAIVWQKTREQSFTPEEFIETHSVGFYMKMLEFIAEAQENKDAVSLFRENTRELRGKIKEQKKTRKDSILKLMAEAFA